MSQSRIAVHNALRPLWEVAEARLHEPDVDEQHTGDTVVRTVETERGAIISSVAGFLSVRAEFEKPDETNETIEVAFAPDIRDLSDSEVRIDWSNEQGAGTNTPKLWAIPDIAREILALI